MSLKLSKTSESPYDYVSFDGDTSNPIVRSVTIDHSGGTVLSSVLEVFLVATDEGEGDIGGYEEIVITPHTEQEGLTWEVSLDGVSFHASVEPDPMYVTEEHQITPVFVRVEADNSEETPLNTGNFSAVIPVQSKQVPPGL